MSCEGKGKSKRAFFTEKGRYVREERKARVVLTSAPALFVFMF